MKKGYGTFLIAGTLTTLVLGLMFFACDNQFLSDAQKIIASRPDQPSLGLPPFVWSTNQVYVINNSGTLVFEPPTISGSLNPSGLSVGFAAGAITTILYPYFDFVKPENSMINELDLTEISAQSLVMELKPEPVATLTGDAQSYVLKVLPPALFGKDKEKFDLNAANLNLTLKPVTNTVWAQRRLESHEFDKVELVWGTDGDTTLTGGDYNESLFLDVIKKSAIGVAAQAAAVFWYGTSGPTVNSANYLNGAIDDTTVAWYNGKKPDLSKGYVNTETLLFDVGEFLADGDTDPPLHAIITVPVLISSTVGDAVVVLSSSPLSFSWSGESIADEDAAKAFIVDTLTGSPGPYSKVADAGVVNDLTKFTFTGLPAAQPDPGARIPVKVRFDIPGAAGTIPEIPYRNYEFTVYITE